MPTQTFYNLPRERRQGIMNVALEEFAGKAYDSVSVNTIVERAKIAKGSFYQYFEDKKDLYLYLIEKAGEQKIEYLSAYREELSGENFFDDLSKLILYGSRFNLSNPLFSALIANALNGPLADETLINMKRMSWEYLFSFLRTARENNQIRDDIPLDLGVFYINSLSTEFAKYVAEKAGFEYYGNLYINENLQRFNDLDLEGMVADLMKLMEHGLGKKG